MEMKQIWNAVWNDVKRWIKPFIMVAGCIVFMNMLFQTSCIQVIIFGIPCAGCGMTRALFACLQGQFVKAFSLNPAVYLWIGYGLFVAFQRYVRFTMKKTTLGLIIVCIFSLLIYGYRMYYIFPGEPPLNFKEDSILGNRVNGYNNLILDLFCTGMK